MPTGASDPAPTPRSGEDIVADLHALVQAADITGPLVLVGHSMGGIFVRQFAAAYPDDVAGLVLVDPLHEDQNIRSRALVGEELRAELQRLSAGFEDAEGIDFDATVDQARAAREARSLPPVPLVVLTHSRPPDASQVPTGWPIAEDERLWRQQHAELAGLVPNGRQVVAERSGHFIQLDQPELVVAAVRDVVAAGTETGHRDSIRTVPVSTDVVET